ncbi:hypothetical protein EI546_12465 [Aequorivita sp. H23M31]|uniref:Uncharacterized protein n=1 Tax=Aequorivita ciconiae TaxID=2494375 RepID=A0A410G5E8_9FLAO|nr:hypothetical protein [Aequorivita sp. H23M31]QAA82483.1 hypothetical protein EI546_12465 [Aequorivita sp. H23M31]
MEREEKLGKLFKEINVKPKDLDQNIMSGIYSHVALEKAADRTDSKPWVWTYILLGILGIGGISYAVSFINFQSDFIIWIIGLTVLIPLVLDKLLFSNRNINLG